MRLGRVTIGELLLGAGHTDGPSLSSSRCRTG